MVVAVIGAMIPDIDHPKSLIGKLFPFISIPLERKFGHRTFTHSFAGALVFTLLFAVVAFLIKLIPTQNPISLGLLNRWIAAFGIGFVSHLCLDMFNKQGSQLLWPNTGRDVIPKNIKYRIESGSKAELYIFFVLLGLVFLALPISKYGFGSSLRWVLATPESAILEYKNLKNHTLIEFKGAFQATHEKVEGSAEILDVVNKQLVVLYNQTVYTLGNDDGSDIVSTKVRVRYTDKPLVIRPVVFKEKTREDLLSQITTASLVSGYVELPADMQLKFPPADIKQTHLETMAQKGNRLILNYAKRTELGKLGLNEQFILLQKQDKTELASLRSRKASIIAQSRKLRNIDDGLTAKGQQIYGDKAKLDERETRIAELQSQIGEIDLRLQAIALRMKAHEFLYTGEVKVRE